jgi:hypothetical protein
MILFPDLNARRITTPRDSVVIQHSQMADTMRKLNSFALLLMA